jgi:hypothetical protein
MSIRVGDLIRFRSEVNLYTQTSREDWKRAHKSKERELAIVIQIYNYSFDSKMHEIKLLTAAGIFTNWTHVEITDSALETL